PLPGSYTGGYGVICRHISRINHSCQPNVLEHWNSKSWTLSIRALSRITKGEELLNSYVPSLVSRAERTKQLARFHDFKCSCPSCSLPSDKSLESDLNRHLLAEDLQKRFREKWDFEAEFGPWLDDPSLPDDYITNHSENIIRMMDQE
ncbi:hypothetical protein FB451DRAFT_973646, partial [Mycena latifolia]